MRELGRGGPWESVSLSSCRNSIVMTCHYLGLDSVSDWLKQISRAARPIRITTQIWVVTRHQHEISVLLTQKLFRGKTSGVVAKCRLSSQVKAKKFFLELSRPFYGCALSVLAFEQTRSWIEVIILLQTFLFFFSHIIDHLRELVA